MIPADRLKHFGNVVASRDRDLVSPGAAWQERRRMVFVSGFMQDVRNIIDAKADEAIEIFRNGGVH